MAYEDYDKPRVSKYITIGGFTTEGVKNPDTFEGYYLGSEQRESNFEDDEGNKKMETNFKFTDFQGNTVQVNGNSRLVFKMQDTTEEFARKNKGASTIGVAALIEYLGVEVKNGKKTKTKLFKVSWDKENILTPAKAAELAAKAASEPSSAGEEGNDGEEETPAVSPPPKFRTNESQTRNVLSKLGSKKA